jgi:lysozyme
MDSAKLKQTIIAAEGVRLKPYTDTTGNLTIGVGHRLANGISEAIADRLLNDDLVEAQRDLEAAWPTLGTLNDVRQRAFIELAFNLGVHGLMLFSKMLHAAAIGDWKNAALELVNSAANAQEPSRFHRLSLMLETGEDVS